MLTTRIAVCENENAIGSTKMCDWQRVLQRSRLLVVRLRAFSLLLFCGGSWACVRACVICKARAASVAGVLRQSGSPLATDMSSSYTHMCCVVSTNFRAKERLVTVFLRSWVTHLAKHPLREIPAAHFEKLPKKKKKKKKTACLYGDAKVGNDKFDNGNSNFDWKLFRNIFCRKLFRFGFS